VNSLAHRSEHAGKRWYSSALRRERTWYRVQTCCGTTARCTSTVPTRKTFIGIFHICGGRNSKFVPRGNRIAPGTTEQLRNRFLRLTISSYSYTTPQPYAVSGVYKAMIAAQLVSLSNSNNLNATAHELSLSDWRFCRHNGTSSDVRERLAVSPEL
jgi:hypothetical protein